MSLSLAVIGGGASGFFAALRVAELTQGSGLSIHIFEASPAFLKKVRISGGGRCNVTHNIFDPKNFVQNYPRGAKELKSPLSDFQASDTVSWFKSRGVEIIAESDGRMFPKTNSSETIIKCFLDEAKKLGVNLHAKHNTQSIEKVKGKFKLTIKDQENFTADQVIIATGSSPTGYKFAKALGHKITDLAPSLFSFKINNALLIDKSGTSFKNAKLNLKLAPQPSLNLNSSNTKKKFKQEGPLLITHWGLSGPAILKLSAWAAREFKSSEYKGTLFVNWMGLNSLEETYSLLNSLKLNNPKSTLKNTYPRELTKSFWARLLSVLEINGEKKISETTDKSLKKLAEALFNYPLEIDGKNRFKEEFVECGGVYLKEVNFKTMESKLCSGLFFTGEILDVDGITGGFNFQNAWTTGWIAGSEIARLHL